MLQYTYMHVSVMKILDEEAKRPFWKKYHSFFHLAEIESSKTLQLFYLLLLSFFALSFTLLSNDPKLSRIAVETGNYTCSPFLPNCEGWYFLTALPHGYSQGLLFALLFGVGILSVVASYHRRWEFAHASLLILFVVQTFFLIILAPHLLTNFYLYHLVLTLVFLLARNRLFFLQFTVVLSYFLAALVKFHDGWILGTYFTALQTGLPLFPDTLTPILTVSILLLELIGVWLLLKGGKGRIAILLLLLIFHLYSVILIGYPYPLIAIGALLLLFGNAEKAKCPVPQKGVVGWFIIFVLLGVNLLPIAVKGDEKHTLEGIVYAFYMFDANHQCISRITIANDDGTETILVRGSGNAAVRCNPGSLLSEVKQVCRGNTVSNWTIDHSINGGPFYRVVDESSPCDLSYTYLRRNEWILLNPTKIGFPVENYYTYPRR